MNLEKAIKISKFDPMQLMIIISPEDFQWSSCTEQTFKRTEPMITIERGSSGSMEDMVMKIGGVKGKTVVLAIADQKELILSAMTVINIGTVVKATIKISVTDCLHILLPVVQFFVL